MKYLIFILLLVGQIGFSLTTVNEYINKKYRIEVLEDKTQFIVRLYLPIDITNDSSYAEINIWNTTDEPIDIYEMKYWLDKHCYYYFVKKDVALSNYFSVDLYNKKVPYIFGHRNGKLRIYLFRYFRNDFNFKEKLK